MPIHFNPNAVLVIIAMHLVLTASVVAPEVSLCLWNKIQGLPKLYRRRRLEKKSRELEKKLKSCWLIDMRKTG